ncbi:class I mannose-6-phosphate isomerase [Novosphingobium sp. RD2P27]|uniref:Class I mannose-6-phosphate isomerase n=1 Tax=Novosphingobium kalidii TaxID=3230299 RepID=A0ABV2CZW7_9SPHN
MSRALATCKVAKPWGRDVLPAPFVAPAAERIGEIWFEPPPELPQLLVKYIFTSEALSIQVHPSDSQTQEKGLGRQGKEECWLIVDAEPGAKLGIGFKAHVDPDRMRKAALNGSIEELLDWHAVAPGDFFYIPANTVHAIGAGVSLIEVQQNSDLTYRLYDYGRPRELHLNDGMAVAKGEPYPASCKSKAPAGGSATLVEGPLFRLDQVAGVPDQNTAARYAGALLVIPREGRVHVAGEEIAPGGCAVADRLAEVAFDSSGLCLLAAPCT